MSHSPTNEEKERGKKAEEKFKEWLNCHKYPFFKLDQDIKSFPEFFDDYEDLKNKKFKRPDFFIALMGAGIIGVDVKARTPLHNGDLCLDEKDDLTRLLNFKETFNVKVYIAFYPPENKCDDKVDKDINWYWADLSKFKDLPIKTKHDDGSKYRSIAMTDCIQINWEEKLNKLLI